MIITPDRLQKITDFILRGGRAVDPILAQHHWRLEPEEGNELNRLIGSLLSAYLHSTPEVQTSIREHCLIPTGRSVHYSSVKQDYETPPAFFDLLDREFHFTLDVCATPETAKCPKYFTPAMDGLSQDWGGGSEICFMNSPYGTQLRKWVKKAYEESQKGATVVCLMPSRTDTKYWHDYVMKAVEIRQVKGRIQFVGAKNPASFPSAVVIFRPGTHKPKFTSMNWNNGHRTPTSRKKTRRKSRKGRARKSRTP